MKTFILLGMNWSISKTSRLRIATLSKNVSTNVLTQKKHLILVARTRIKENLNVFMAGDVVEVITGELTNLRGKVLSVEKDVVSILPDHAELKVK